jgi:hypothetical protein
MHVASVIIVAFQLCRFRGLRITINRFIIYEPAIRPLSVASKDCMLTFQSSTTRQFRHKNLVD